jgi:hypothetical protein
MITNPLASELAAERRRDMLKAAERRPVSVRPSAATRLARYLHLGADRRRDGALAATPRTLPRPGVPGVSGIPGVPRTHPEP